MKSKWVDVWVCRDSDGDVSVWRYETNVKIAGPKCPDCMKVVGRWGSMLLDVPLLAECKYGFVAEYMTAPGTFARTYGSENLPAPGTKYNCLLEL